jgi:nucleotide-binding universal stress UspA family protein
MTHPIIVGYDGSACAEAALAEATDLARSLKDGEVVLVCCHDAPPGLSCALDPACAAAKELRDYERRVEDELDPILHRAADRVRASGVRAEVVLAWEDPTRALVRVAGERGSHVIVVGSEGRGPLSGVVSRHTCFELLHRSPVPVLVVPHRA